MKAAVHEAHVRSYENPIAFKRGDRVCLTGRSDNWNGHQWVWAIGPDGREGWIPPHTVACRDEGIIAQSDYSARELSVAVGDVVDVLHSDLGWCWCADGQGQAGWVPEDKLQPC